MLEAQILTPKTTSVSFLTGVLPASKPSVCHLSPPEGHSLTAHSGKGSSHGVSWDRVCSSSQLFCPVRSSLLAPSEKPQPSLCFLAPLGHTCQQPVWDGLAGLVGPASLSLLEGWAFDDVCCACLLCKLCQAHCQYLSSN